MSSRAALNPWIGRFFVVLCSLTFVAELVSLQLRNAVFGGSAWLSHVKYVAWPDRIGLVLILAVFSVAATGIWLLVWSRGLQLLRVSGFRALSAASALWIVLLLADTFIRQRVSSLFGSALRLFDMSRGVGGPGTMLKNIWSWYGELIVIVAISCVGIGFACYTLFRFLKKSRRSWGGIDRITRRGVAIVVAVSTAVALAFLTLFSQTWPSTRDLLTAETLVGMPFGALVIATTDFDGDGFSPFGSPPDREPFDPLSHPYAVDVPGDGADEDQIAGDLKTEDIDPLLRKEVEAVSTYPPVQFSLRRNVILILLESVRYDALETRIRGLEATPVMTRMIREGALAPPHAYASNGFTQATMMNLFWGNFFHPGTTLIDDFQSNGYTIASFSASNLAEEGHETNLGIGKSDLIMDARQLEVTLPQRTVPARRLVTPIVEFLRSHDPTQPFFLFVQFDDPHFPYLQQNPFVLTDGPISIHRIHRDNLEELRGAYYNQVYHVDKAVGVMMEALRETGLEDETIVVIMSDHGESLFDDGLLLGHGTRINEVMTHCLMLVQNATRDVPEVLSHYHLRGLLREMLTHPPTDRPRLVPVPGRKILNFLGDPQWPSQIGEFSIEQGRLIYDFKTNRVFDERTQAGGAFDRDRLGADLYRRARALILGWEYLHYINRDHGRWR